MVDAVDTTVVVVVLLVVEVGACVDVGATVVELAQLEPSPGTQTESSEDRSRRAPRRAQSSRARLSPAPRTKPSGRKRAPLQGFRRVTASGHDPAPTDSDA